MEREGHHQGSHQEIRKGQTRNEPIRSRLPQLGLKGHGRHNSGVSGYRDAEEGCQKEPLPLEIYWELIVIFWSIIIY